MFMSIQASRSLPPLLIGSLLVLSLACRSKDDPSNVTDTTSSPPQTATSAPSTPTPSAPTPGAMPDKRPGSVDLKADDRMPVAGREDLRNDSIELGAGGSTGMGGSGGGSGKHH